MRAPIRLASALIACVLLSALALDVPVTTAVGTTTDADELTRLLAGERVEHGLPALAVDPYLEYVATDGPVPCPTGPGGPGKTAQGRARDMAVSGYVSHTLRLCPDYDIGSALTTWGYLGHSGQTAGEVIATNSGYDDNPFPYQFGCDLAQDNCTGATTNAPTTVAIAAYGLMTSPGHRYNVLSSSFDRIGCGSWRVAWDGHAGQSTSVFVCLYASGPGSMAAPSASVNPTPDTSPAPDNNAPSPAVIPTPTAKATPKPAPKPIKCRKVTHRWHGHRGLWCWR